MAGRRGHDGLLEQQLEHEALTPLLASMCERHPAVPAPTPLPLPGPLGSSGNILELFPPEKRNVLYRGRILAAAEGKRIKVFLILEGPFKAIIFCKALRHAEPSKSNYCTFRWRE